MFFPGDNQDKAYVNWTIPSGRDNEDTKIVPRQIAGPSQAASFSVGSYTITYEAEDRAGNQAEPCSFTVVVKREYIFTKEENFFEMLAIVEVAANS